MNQKELNEIRRRIRPEHNNIRNIYGCYVNTAKEIISSFDASTGLLSQDEAEKYFFLLKKTLSGALGKNLAELEFETRSVAEGKDLRLLSAMLEKGPGDDVLRDEFFRSIISSIDMQDQNYLILLAQDIYDVPQHTKDGEADDRGDVYRFLLCSICPVKSGKAELGYSAEDRRFCTSSAGQIAAAPECGFLYPAFDGLEGDPIRAVLERGVKVAGATAFFADGDGGVGGIILQKAIDVLPDDTPESLGARVMEECEWKLLSRAVALYCGGKLSVHGKRVIVAE